MAKLKVLLCVASFLFLCTMCNGQESEIYEFPFSLEKKLLVFKGQLNGVETDFAFDTGAAEGIANTKNETSKGIERSQSSQRILDANKEIAYLQTGITKKLTIGGFTFDNVRASITDMQYLYCMDLYLLGADVIRQLNWEIDFQRMMIRVSKKRFETNESMTIIPVKYEYNTPRIKLTLNNVNFSDVLVDFGYNGIMTVPNTDDKVQHLIAQKKEKQLVTTQLSASFAAMGLSKPVAGEIVVLDSVAINGSNYYKIPAEFRANTSFKVGVGFFSGTCDKVIINNSDKKYYLQLKNANTFNNTFPISVLLKDGKLKISSLVVEGDSQIKDVVMDEEIASVDGKTAADFKSECEFITWYYTKKREVLVIEKQNGQKLELRKSPYR